MEPLLLKPAGKDYLWGGVRLKKEYGKDIDLTPLAETWECSVHPEGQSLIASGRFKGTSLSNLLKKHPEYIGSKANGNFPILVKFIDAKKDLSVQVHPGDDFAREHENDNGKTEMWYVLEAEPDARLICGFAHDVTKEKLKKAVSSGTLQKHLQVIPVKKGDVFFIPAGTIHAIGRGVLIAEIQESSNVTYRVYDYDRIDKDGKKRPLHFEKAVQVLDMKAGATVRQKPRKVDFRYGSMHETLCRCKYFETEHIISKLGFDFLVFERSFQVLLCLSGDCGITCESCKRPLRFKKGDCVFIPAGMGRCRILGEAELLKIRC